MPGRIRGILMTNMKNRSLMVPMAFALLFSATGCRDPIPCPDCDEQADEQEDGPPSDLPCGGVDLMTDDLNCGSCGNECTLWYPGTQWEAGGCQSGECTAPAWNVCLPEAFGATCEEVCAGYGNTCAANGCSDFTVLLFNVGFDGVCGEESQPYQALASACDEPIPWDSPFPGEGYTTYAMCCCESP